MSPFWKDTIREIIRTKARFILLLVISMLGSMSIICVTATAINMRDTADMSYKAQRLYDVQIKSATGFTGDDVAAVRETSGVASVMPTYVFDVYVNYKSSLIPIRTYALPDGMNDITLLEGRLPAKNDECAFERNFMNDSGYSIGDRVLLSLSDADEYNDAFTANTFTITGVVSSPLYLTYERGVTMLGIGTVRYYAYFHPDAYALERFTDVYIRMDGSYEMHNVSDEYKSAARGWATLLKETGEARIAVFNGELADKQIEIDDGWEDYYSEEREAEEKLADAREELLEKWQELEDALRDLNDGERELENEIEDKTVELMAEAVDFVDAEAELRANRKTYGDSLSEYADNEKKFADEEADARKKLADTKAELDDAQKEINAKQADYDDSTRKANEKIAAGRAELADAMKKLANTKRQLDDAQKSLDAEIENRIRTEMLGSYRLTEEQMATYDIKSNSAYEKVREAVVKAYAEAQAELDAKVAEYNASVVTYKENEDRFYDEELAARAELAAARVKLEAARADLARGRADYDAAARDVDKKLGEGRAELADAKKDLDDAQKKLDDAQRELDDAQAGAKTDIRSLMGYAAARAEVESDAAVKDARAELDDKWAEYNDGLKEYWEKEEEFMREEAEAYAELADARAELADAQAELDDAPEAKWFYLTREDDSPFDSYYQDTMRLERVGVVFPLVFFLVAVLVALTTMTRMVEEHRTQIGIYLALGYNPAFMIRKFAVYALVPGIIGGALGVAGGSKVIPLIIADAYAHLYYLPPILTPVPWGIAAVSVTAAVVSVVGVTLITCAGSMRSRPATLMRPKAPKLGKRVFLEKIPAIWGRLTFLDKVTARNIFRYKRRFIMSLVGVAGCTALLLTGFGLKDSIGRVARLQYGEIVTYDAVLYLSDKLTAEARASIESQTPTSRLFIREEGVDISTAVGSVAAKVIVPEKPSELNSYQRMVLPADGEIITFTSVGIKGKQKTVAFPDAGALISEKLARDLGVSRGDSVELELTAGGNARATATIAGIVENYLFHFVFVSPEYYTELFGKEAKPNELIMSGGFDAGELLKSDGVRGILYSSDMLKILEESSNAMSIVTFVLLIMACALSFVVLFTLTVININERLRELATLKVLGFQNSETAQYLYREIILVTLIGIAIGMVGGIFLNNFVISSVEVDMLKFPRSLDLASFLLSAELSFLFALLVCLMTRKRLFAIDMVESLKNNE